MHFLHPGNAAPSERVRAFEWLGRGRFREEGIVPSRLGEGELKSNIG